MATIFESISLKGLRKTHLEQLLSYVEARDQEGWYYGNKEQWEARHHDIKNWLQSAVDYANSEGVKMPKKDKP